VATAILVGKLSSTINLQKPIIEFVLKILQISAAVMGDLAGAEAVTTRAALGRFPSIFLSSKESLSLLSHPILKQEKFERLEI
jgi:hypothetical protein